MLITNIKNSKDIKIEDGIITEIGDNLSDEEVYDAKNAEIFPLCVDLNVKNSESISKLNVKALKGGVGTILMIPQNKPIYNKLHLAYNLTKEKDIDLLVAIEAIHEGKLSDIHILVDKGASALFINSDEDMNLIKRVFQYAEMLKVPVFINANNKALLGNGKMNASDKAYSLGLEGIENYVESVEVAKILEFSKNFDVKVVFQAITTKESLELLKNKNKNIFVDVCIDNLLYTDENINDFDTFYKTFPPIRSEDDRKALLEAVKNEEIDFISSNHIAVKDETKDVPFEVAEFGISKLDKFAKLLYSLDIKTETLSKLASTNPAKFFGLNEGIIEVGKKAKFMLASRNFIDYDQNNTKKYEFKMNKSFIFKKKY
jgi:dihydroorotase